MFAKYLVKYEALVLKGPIQKVQLPVRGVGPKRGSLSGGPDAVAVQVEAGRSSGP